jgi:phosphomannomutase
MTIWTASSSHNPALYSGFKVRTSEASAAAPEVLAQIEAWLPEALSGRDERMALGEAKGKGLVETFDPRPEYLRHVSALVEIERLREAGLRVVVDPMYGAGSGYLRELLSGGRSEVIEIRSERNPAFPGMYNPEPIARNLEATREAVIAHGAQVALATDGDADRIGVMDHRGEFVDQLRTFALLAYYLLEVRGLRGPIVKSVTTTSMVLRLGEVYGVPVHETGVGFKFLGPKMIETDALIAGEESGGFAFRGHLPERDGILSGLYILDLMARRDKDLPALIEEVFA